VLGRAAAVSTGVLTLVTFALALTALPNVVPYPFTSAEIAAQWPGDYLWMYPAILLMVSFVALVAAIHECAPPDRRVYSLLALCGALASAMVLVVDYYVQATVMQPNLEKGQLDGWSLLTQYNPNGVFIALEELGYLAMTVTMLCLVPVLDGSDRVRRVLRWLFAGSFAVAVAALAVVSARQGIDRGDTFEIAVIVIVWLVLLVASPLLAVDFHRRLRTDRS
jgi:uncharacterized membrane protein